jgi:DNA polymerase sigma
LGVFEEAVPVDFSVNAVTPLYNAALLTECGQKDPRAKALILLVKRWAKDRGVCHAAKGHLSPYLWSILTIYFLQVGVPDEGQILPPLEVFETYAGLMEQSRSGVPSPSVPAGEVKPQQPSAETAKPGVPKRSMGRLFKDFMHFYTSVFDWRNEAVRIRLGKRAPPDLAQPLHIILHSGGDTSEVGPSIEDPFDPTKNLGSCMTATSLERLRAELKRADDLCTSEVSLTQLLEPWIPPEHGSAEHEQGKEDDDEE